MHHFKTMLRCNVIPFLLVLFYICLTRAQNLTTEDMEKYKHLIQGQGLYSPEDHMLILTGHNFKQETYGKPYRLLIEFYSSWCGFCQRFSPTWKSLAAELQDWKDVIRLGAIDCYEMENIPICRDFEISSTPTLKYFHENYQEGPGNTGVDVEPGANLYTLKYGLYRRFIEEQQEGRAKTLPNLLPYTFENITSVTEDNHSKYVMLVFERQNTYFGIELAIVLRNTPQVSVKYSLSNNTELIHNANINASVLPALLALDVGRGAYKVYYGLKSARKTLKVFKKFLNTTDNINLPEIPKYDIFTGNWLNSTVAPVMAFLKEERKFRRTVKEAGDVLFQEDLEMSLRNAFKQEIGGVKKHSDERLKALKAFVSVLVKYFPFGKKGKEFLTDVQEKINSAGSTVLGEDVFDWIKKAEQDKQIFSFPYEFVGCKGSAPHYRGYTCTLWRLFHYLTVNAAIQNEGVEDAHPREILDAMHGYVEYHFKCSDCSQHFLKMANERQMEKVSTLDGAVLWLWDAHNSVNKRLSGDSVEDPEYPKLQFPSNDNCPSCGTTNGTGWIHYEVLQYLKKIYNKDNIVHYVDGKVEPWKPEN